MDWTDLVEKLGDRSRAVPASEFSADDPGASDCGVYTWWADETAQRVIERALGADASSVICVGKAGGGTSSQTLATRIVGKHLKSRANIGSSTLRKSLTAILMKDKAFAAEHTSSDAVARSPILSDWMREHLKVAIAPVDRPEQVKHAEEAALKYCDPPLNLLGVTRTPARAQLRTLRKALLADGVRDREEELAAGHRVDGDHRRGRSGCGCVGHGSSVPQAAAAAQSRFHVERGA